MVDLNKLPAKVGIYKFLNKRKDIIYIGKAKNIKSRVKQYFKTGSHKSEYFKSLIFDVEYILTKSENEALLLEINLIKTHKPKFNIIFKDDKSYPYICIIDKNGDLKVEARRSKQARLKNCFGPFPAGSKPFLTTRAIEELYKLKKCKKAQSRCVYYQLEQCLHLKGKEKEKYNKKAKKEIITFFKGKGRALKEFAQSKMEKFSQKEEYESAQKYKDILSRLDIFTEKQSIFSKSLENGDYIGFKHIENTLAVFIIHVRIGKIVNTFSKRYDVIGNKLEAFKNFIISYYQSNPSPNYIYLTINIEEKYNSIFETQFKVPKIGEKKNLLNLANQNASELINSVIKSQNKKEEFISSWNDLANFVGVKNLVNLEIYDASHTFGKNYVGAKVEYEYGKYISSKTRKYDLSSIIKANDTKAMNLMIEKRFKNNREIPDLIIVDGGKGQINSVLRVLYKLDIETKVIGLIKDDKHKSKYIMLQNGKRTLIKDLIFKKLLQEMQEKVHTVAIGYHQLKRKKDIIKK